MACLDKCHCAVDNRRQGSILYNILKNEESHHSQGGKEEHRAGSGHGCSCGSQKKVSLRSPQVTCKAASAVLVKTLRFVKSVPCFQELPIEDQLMLVRSCWAPLLVLGLAQDKVELETIETSEPSMLQKILTNRHEAEKAQQQEPRGGRGGGGGGGGHQHQHKVTQLPSAAEIRWIKEFLDKCWSLDISTKEYAYLKGTVLFNPDLPGLRCIQYIQGLQQEAQQALNEHVKMIHRWDQTRFTKLIIVLSLLRSINANAIAELFFRPIIGSVSMDDMLLEMLGAKI